MKSTRLFKLISIMLSAMLVFSLFPTQALADSDKNSDPLPMYTVKFLDWDGRLIDSVQVEEGSDASAPAHPTREGYEADGWDKSFSNVKEDLVVTALYKAIAEPTPTIQLFTAESMPTSSNTVVVKFYAKSGSLVATYTITGLSDGQISGLPDRGSSLIDALNAYYHTQSGSYFLGMSDFGNNDFTNNSSLHLSGFRPNYSVRADLNFDLSASYTVRYVSTGGNTIRDSVTATGNIGTSITVTAPSIPGYNLNSSSPVTFTLLYGGNTITFVYAPITYSISYTLNNGTNAPGNPTSYTPDSPAITLLAPTRTGYDFSGWTPEGVIPTGSTGNKSFSAGWTLTQYPITYNLNGGTNAPGNPSYYTITTPTFTIASPTRTGYTFAGWTPSSTTITMGSQGSRSFTASWTPITYSISYELSGGTNAAGNPSSYTPDSPLITLGDPTRVGYTFSYWSPTNAITPGSTGNKTFTAVWSAVDYPISYTLNGGINADSNPASYTVSTPTITLAAPTREGYTFDGWSPSGTIPLGSTGAKTFVVSWTPITYTISYILNNGTNPLSNPTSYTPASPDINLANPTREGYTFSGWTPSGSIPTGTIGNLTFEANWSPISYTIHYTLNGGTNATGNPETYTPNDPEITLLDPTRNGYTFSGWTPAGVIPAGSYGDQSFEASWTPITYTISYDLNGGVNATGNPATYTPDDPDITLLAATREGYTFAGWSPASLIPTGSVGNLSFEASWTPLTYSISYVLNGGENATGNPESYTPDDATITLLDPTRTGFTFTGWSPSGSIPTGSMGDKTFTAGWRANTYSITYIMNGGTNAPGNPSGFASDSPTITLLDPTRNGYTFTGWTPTNTIPTGTTESKTFTANWNTQVYTILYNLNGGTNAPGNPTTYTIESARIDLLAPTRAGYTFVRWSPSSYIAAGSTGNKTFNAVWTPTQYKITYVLGGGTNSFFNPREYDIEDNTITLRDPVRAGYDFTGWTPQGVIPKGSTGEKTFTAGWTPKTYSISYELFGGTNAPTNPSSYTIESDSISLAAPTKAGYTFLGWLLSSGTIPHGSVGDRYFVAVWSLPIRYNITYTLNGGVNAPSNPSRYWVISDTITLAAPTRTGYTFAGWTPDGVIPKGSTGDKAFTASWTPIAYSISYDLAGGSATGNPDSYTIETPTFTLNDPTRDFYTFAGWTPSDATIEQGSTGNLSFTANWTPIAYTINYVLNGGTNASGNPGSYTVETPTFTLENPTRDYYTFAGWTPDDATIEQGSTGELTFTASWTPVTYNISYDLAGGINAPTNPATYTVETPDFTLADPARLGYTFLGWTPTDTTIETGSHGDLSFTALWSDANVYTITYDLAGGVNAPTNPATYTVESAAITLAAPTRAGYTFLGWTPEGTIPAGSTGNRNFTATWSAPIIYGIVYVLNGGVNAAGNPATYTVESPAITLGAPTRAGYTFTGWTPAGGIPAGSTGPRTFTATWSAPIEYPITYVLGGGVNAAGNPATYNVTSGLITLLDPTRTGYDFLGWTPTDTIPAASTGARTFTATWSQPHVHSVTYFVSGGTLAGLDGATPFAVYRDVAYGAPVPIPDDPAQDTYTFDGWSSAIPTTMPDEDIVFYGTLTKSPVLQEIIANEKTPLAGPTWSLLNLILTVLTAFGLGSIISMLLKKRNGNGSGRNTVFSLLTLLPAAGAIVAFLLTQVTSGSMVFADRWSILMGGITVLQGALVALGNFGSKKA